MIISLELDIVDPLKKEARSNTSIVSGTIFKIKAEKVQRLRISSRISPLRRSVLKH